MGLFNWFLANIVIVDTGNLGSVNFESAPTWCVLRVYSLGLPLS